MNDIAKYDPETGELVSTALASFDAENAPLAVRLAKVELDQAISTAKAYPRSLTRVRDNVSALVMLDEETAKECVYALPRGGKPIKGPSVRFAEIVASQFGNCKVGSRVVDVNKFDKYVEAEGVFIDLESGMQRTARIRRKISDKNGRVYNDDMIVVTGNAACAIALREAILKGVPKALWRRAYQEAEGVIAGDIKTLAERREGAIRAFAAWGITPDQIFASLEIAGLDEIGLDQIATLTSMYMAIKAGEQQVEDYFPAKSNAAAGVEAAKGTAGKLAAIAGGNAKETAGKAEQAEARADAYRGDAAEGAENQHSKLADGGKSVADQRAEEERAHYAAEAEKAAQEGNGADPGPDTAAKGEKAAGGPENSPGDQSGEDAEGKAYGRGRKAFARGMTLDACPPDLKKNEALAEAWANGWKDARDEAE